MPEQTNVPEPVSARSLGKLVAATFSSWNGINAPRLGAALAFYAVLSIAPLLVLCIGIAGLAFGREIATSHVEYQVENVVGPQGGKLIHALILDTAKPASGIIA